MDSATAIAPRRVEPGRLLTLIDAIAGRRLLIVGDLIADEFIYGEIARVSREAPVLILNYDSTEVVPGGAGNAANNVAALGGAARIIGLTGRDETGRRLLATLKRRRVDVKDVIRPTGYTTPTKTRILAGGIHSAKQQVVRIDRGTRRRATPAERARVAAAALAATASIDGVLISDYGFGLVTPRLVAAIRRAARTRTGTRPPILVDSRYELARYTGLTAATPNEAEAEALAGESIGDDVRALERVGRRLLEATRMGALLVTRGSRGMALFERGQATRHIPIFGSDEIADVTGAGDTVIATMTLAMAAGASAYDAAQLANIAGGIVVMKRGTATVSADELRAALAGGRTAKAGAR